MYAVFKLGGNQHRAQVGDTFKVQRLDGQVGDKVEITDIFMVRKDEKMVLGTPMVAGAKVVAEIVGQGREKKVLVMKFARRNSYRRKVGHRQPFTKVTIRDVIVP